MPSSSHAIQALYIPDIIIAIISHTGSQQDRLNFSSITRCCYETCTVPRVRSVVVTRSETALWSFLSYIRRWKIAGCCRSLTIDPGSSVPVTTTTLCLVSLILKEIGDSAEPQLEYLSKNLVLDDFGLSDRPIEEPTSSFEELAAECEKRINGEASEEGLYHSIRDLASSSNVNDKDTSPKFWQQISRMTSLEELNITMKQHSWSAFCAGVYGHVKTLQLHVFFHADVFRNLTAQPPLSHPFQRLETLKLSSFAGPEPTQFLQFAFPSLRAFEIRTADPADIMQDGTLSRMIQFIERHPNIQSVSLGESYSRSAGRMLQSAQNVRALRLFLPFSGNVLGVPAALGAIPHITHLRLSGAVSAVLIFLKNSPARPKLPHFRCIELECGDARDFKNMMRPSTGRETPFGITQLWGLFPNVVEIAFSVSFGRISAYEMLPTLLERLQDCSVLLAIRLRNTDLAHSDDPFPVGLMEKIEAIPPKLRYIVWENQTTAQTYELSADNGATKVRKVARIPSLRSVPAKGRWSIDWHEESVFDHIAENYEE